MLIGVPRKVCRPARWSTCVPVTIAAVCWSSHACASALVLMCRSCWRPSASRTGAGMSRWVPGDAACHWSALLPCGPQPGQLVCHCCPCLPGQCLLCLALRRGQGSSRLVQPYLRRLAGHATATHPVPWRKSMAAGGDRAPSEPGGSASGNPRSSSGPGYALGKFTPCVVLVLEDKENRPACRPEFQ